jgi:hypothetical protein
MKTAKELLASGEPLPEGVSPEDLPAAMEHDSSDLGHGDYIPKTFLRITPLDKAGRRALWARFEPLFTPTSVPELKEAFYECDGRFVELRAGREGDDEQLTLTEGDVLTRETIQKLVSILLRAKDGLDI